jgi:predicted 3-demethylubiquinone-9 3-methyltransferase (glyoxalase superfamily)
MKKITPFLWFDGNAEEAVEFYTGIFPNSAITHTSHSDEAGPGEPGSVLTIGFSLNGNEMTALNGGPAFKFSEAISLFVHCDDQDEIDYYWEKLLEGGTPMACGWLKDKFGVAWQIVPAGFFEMITSDDEARNSRVKAAMNTMIKFDIAALEAAYHDKNPINA